MTYEAELELLSEEELQERAERLKAAARREGMAALAKTIETKLASRITNRALKQEEWLECSHLYYGNLYSSTNYLETPFSNGTNSRRSRPDFNIVRAKVDTAIAQCIDMQFALGEKNWDLWPASNSESDPSIVRKAELMSSEIQTQLDNCRYAYKARQAIRNRVLLGTGILKGPTNTGKVTTVYGKDETSGIWLSETIIEYSPTISFVDPWFFFPDDTVSEASDIADAIEVHPMTATQLKALCKHKGFDSKAIEKVLESPPEMYTTNVFTEYKRLTDANPALFKNKYCVMEYNGPLKKKDIVSAGVETSTEAVLEDYFGEAWVVNGQMIRLELENIEGSYEVPYCISSWKKDPASVFGFGHPLTMKDQQRVVTQTWHMVLDNASISSGPQVAIQQRYITPADGTWELAPRKLWYLNDPMLKVGDAIEFFNVPNVLDNLFPVLGMAREFSEEESGTNALAGGLESTQLGGSATGDMIAMKNSTVLLDAASEEWDDEVTAKIIRRMYAWNMQYSEKDDIKGNFSIDVRTANEYKNKQVHARDLEKLSVEMGQNPHVAKWIKPDVLTNIRFSLMALPTRNLLRTQEEADAWEKQQAEQAAQNDPAAMKAQVDMAKLQLEEKRLQMDAQLSQAQLHIEEMRAKMDAQMMQMKEHVAMANTQAMALAAQASTLKAQLDYQARMAKVQLDGQLAGVANTTEAMKFDVDKQIEIAALQQEGAIRNAENEIYKEEIKLKKQGKTGI